MTFSELHTVGLS